MEEIFQVTTAYVQGGPQVQYHSETVADKEAGPASVPSHSTVIMYTFSQVMSQAMFLVLQQELLPIADAISSFDTLK